MAAMLCGSGAHYSQPGSRPTVDNALPKIHNGCREVAAKQKPRTMPGLKFAEDRIQISSERRPGHRSDSSHAR